MRKIVEVLVGLLLVALALYGMTINGWLDLPLISAPANPASGSIRLFPNTSTGKLACLNSSGADCMPSASTTADEKLRVCEVAIGDPGAASSALTDDNDSPVVCSNKTSGTLAITAVECYANAGSPTVTPIITGGSGTSILSGALTCGTASFASGSLNGSPTQASGGTIDANITTAGGTAKYIVIRITRSLP